MSDERDPETDQQLPVPNDRTAIQDLVIADIEGRKALGLHKYGTLLQAFNGRDMLLDAYEEILDLTIYIRGRLEEDRERQSAYLEELKELFTGAQGKQLVVLPDNTAELVDFSTDDPAQMCLFDMCYCPEPAFCLDGSCAICYLPTGRR